MRDRVEAALHRYLRNLHVTDGQQLARIADAHIRYILQESLFRDLFEEAAKGAAVHIRHFGNLVELEGTGVIAVDEGDDFINPFVACRGELLVVERACQHLLWGGHGQSLQ